MKKISVIGVGRLGLCFSLALERAGFEVFGVDQDENYAAALGSKTYVSTEPEVSDYLRASRNFHISPSVEDAVQRSDLVFVFVATPSLENHRFDHSQIFSVVDRLPLVSRPKHLVISCTVMPRTSDEIAARLSEKNWVVSYSPSFIAQGSVMRDLLTPDFVLIGEGSEKAGDELQEVYHKLCGAASVHRMSRLSAEITKLGLNCFVTQKIAFANWLGDLASRSGAEPEKILSAIGSDSRVGPKYFSWGYGFGGPCFPRDNQAMEQVANDYQLEPIFAVATQRANELHLAHQIEVFERQHSKSEPIELGPVSYNGKTPSIERSQQLELAVCLARRGYLITIVDRVEVLELVRSQYGDLFKYPVKRETKPWKPCRSVQPSSVVPGDSLGITS